MHVNEAIKLRRSIKHYDPKHVMTKEEIHALLSNTILSPTAFNIQNAFIRLLSRETSKSSYMNTTTNDKITN